MIQILVILLSVFTPGKVQDPPPPDPLEYETVGVYQGQTLFIQNPYLPTLKQFCVKSVFINDVKQDLNYNLSALKINFEDQDLYTPVKIRIQSADSLCNPIIINPDAIMFHTAYKFLEVNLSDSALYWKTHGERETGEYIVEKYDRGIWREVARESAKTKFEVSEYIFRPHLDEGGNKYRVKYEFGNGRFLYSSEAIYDFYPDPVEIHPKNSSTMIYFSRNSFYEIYDQNNKMVLSGTDDKVDIRRLWPADYVIYFDGKDPQVFTKDRY